MKPYDKKYRALTLPTGVQHTDDYETDYPAYEYRYHHARVDAVIDFMELMLRLHPHIKLHSSWKFFISSSLLKQFKPHLRTE